MHNFRGLAAVDSFQLNKYLVIIALREMRGRIYDDIDSSDVGEYLEVGG